MTKKLTRQELLQYLDLLLAPEHFSDYGPNGLQVEGQEIVSKMAFAVSATADSIQEAIRQNCDTLIVHHGLFWKFHGPRPLTGPWAQRVFPLVRHEMNLFAYHLPLDAHLEVGNAATLGRFMGLKRDNIRPLCDPKGMPLGIAGEFASPILPLALKEKLEHLLQHPVLLSCHDEKSPISSLGIITGGANSEWVYAKSQNLDAYCTGEMSEHDWHEAKEAGIHMFAGGHNATERFGIQALMEKIRVDFSGRKIEVTFIPSPNPA